MYFGMNEGNMALHVVFDRTGCENIHFTEFLRVTIQYQAVVITGMDRRIPQSETC
jgi:hypothetical protein